MNAYTAVRTIRKLLADKLIAKKYAHRVLARVKNWLKTRTLPRGGWFSAAEVDYVTDRCAVRAVSSFSTEGVAAVLLIGAVRM